MIDVIQSINLLSTASCMWYYVYSCYHTDKSGAILPKTSTFRDQLDSISLFESSHTAYDSQSIIHVRHDCQFQFH